MFCKTCGKEVADGIKFCPACGSELNNSERKVEDNVQNSLSINLDKVIEIKGKRAGEESFFYVALWLFLLLFAVGTWVSWIIFFGLTIYAFMKIPRTVSYNSFLKKIITNEKAHFSPLRKSIDISIIENETNYEIKKNHLPFKEAFRFSIKNIFGHKVKLIFSLHHALSIPGEYFVVALDTRFQNRNLNIWFSRENEMREFLALLVAALKENGKNIPINENPSVIKTKDFYDECKSEKENITFGGFVKKNIWKAVATFIIFLIIGYSTLSSVNGIDAGLDKMESVITRMERFKQESSSGDMSYGEIMEEYSKLMQELEDATSMMEGYAKSDYTAEQWDRLFKLAERASAIK